MPTGLRKCNCSDFANPSICLAARRLLFHERGVNAQWRQLKTVKIFIHRQIKRSELEASEPLPENKSLDMLKLTPLRERIQKN
jgi:hypothetical protein